MAYEYGPLSRRAFKETAAAFSDGRITAFEMDAGAGCSHCVKSGGGCIYCDSKVGKPNEGELDLSQTLSVLDQIAAIGGKRLYICGIGEPLEDGGFWGIAEYAKKNGIALSVFTNGLAITPDVAKRLHDLGVCVIVKCDSMNETTFDMLLGHEGTATRIHDAIRNLANAGYGTRASTGETDLALSVVPTTLNLRDIPDVVRFSMDIGAFPLIAELECAGRAKERFKELQPSKEQLLELKREVEAIWGPYEGAPACPASFGLHVSDTGEVVADKRTGFACKWPWLGEIETVSFGNIKTSPLSEIAKDVWGFQTEKEKEIRLLGKIQPEQVFGGCSGKLAPLLGRFAFEISQRNEKNARKNRV